MGSQDDYFWVQLKRKKEPGIAPHTCNSIYLGGRECEEHSLRLAWEKAHEIPFQTMKLGMVAHTCQPNYARSVNSIAFQTGLDKKWDPIRKKQPKQTRARGVVKCLSSTAFKHQCCKQQQRNTRGVSRKETLAMQPWTRAQPLASPHVLKPSNHSAGDSFY
jgi:hypothetical protein